MLTLNAISKSYPKFDDALRAVSLEVGHGVLGLLGPNGAGKSTLIEILASNLLPSRGTALLGGRVDVVRHPVEWRRRLGYLPQGFDFPGQVTGREMMLQVAALRGLDVRRTRPRIEALLDRANLLDAADRYAAGYSRGMKQRLGIVIALLADPELLLLDEPTAGLDPVERLFFRELLAEVGATRVVILSTHIVGDVERCCSRVAVLNGGAVVFDGPPTALAAQAKGRAWRVPVAAAGGRDLITTRRVVALSGAGEQPWARIVAAEKPTPDSVELEPGVADGYVLLVEGAAVGQDITAAV